MAKRLMELECADFMKVVTRLSLSTDHHRTTFSPVPRTVFSSAPKQDVFPLIYPTKITHRLSVQSFISSQTAAGGDSILQNGALQRAGGREESRREAGGAPAAKTDLRGVRGLALATLTPHTLHLCRKPACLL